MYFYFILTLLDFGLVFGNSGLNSPLAFVVVFVILVVVFEPSAPVSVEPEVVDSRSISFSRNSFAFDWLSFAVRSLPAKYKQQNAT